MRQNRSVLLVRDVDIVPDIVFMAKSIGGIGMPLAITLLKPEYDVLSHDDDKP